MNEPLEQFKCRHPSGECLMGLHQGLPEDYTVEGTRVLFRGKELGDLREKTLQEIICWNHCDARFFEEVLGARDDRQRLRVVVVRTPGMLPREY